MKTINYKGETCVKAKVIMLPTERSNMCKLIDLEDNSFEIKLQPNKDAFKDDKSHGFHIQPFELYIITDEKIEKDDWFLYLSSDTPITYKCNRIDSTFERQRDECKKIVASTDASLKTEIDGYRGDLLPDVSFDIELPQPPQAFIEAYCKAGGIDEVLVEVEPVVFGEVDGEIIYDWEHKIKTDSHNTITIHPVEEKTFTLSEVEEITRKVVLDYTAKGYSRPISDWNKENL